VAVELKPRGHLITSVTLRLNLTSAIDSNLRNSTGPKTTSKTSSHKIRQHLIRGCLSTSSKRIPFTSSHYTRSPSPSTCNAAIPPPSNTQTYMP
jgi:hypothetical protein